MAKEEKPKEGKPTLRERLFSQKVPQPDHGSAPSQPESSGSSANEPPSDSGKKGASAQKHHSGLFSFTSFKPKTKSSNGGNSSETPAGEQNTASTRTKPVNKLDPWSRAYTELRNHDSTKKLVMTYEKIFTYRVNPSNTLDELIPENTPNHFDTLSEAERVEKLTEILQPVLDKYQEEGWWKTAAEGADIVVSRIGKGVGDALQSCQPAAFAWSAICLLVPVSSRRFHQSKIYRN
jgi:N-terminal domain of NWD NACHT-NTPase